MLAQQIQRLLVSEKDKKRVIDQLQELDEGKKLELAQLIQEHDKEALQLLNEKSEEVDAVKGQLDTVVAPVEDTQEDLQEVRSELKTILADPEQISRLIAESDDQQLNQIQQLIESGLVGKEDLILQSQQFFQEVRLQKTAFVKADQDEKKRLMQEAILSRKEQNQKLEGVIKEAEKALGKKYA